MLIYVACWPLLAYFAGNLIPAIGSGDLSKVSSIIVKSLFVFLVQKIAQFGQDVFIAKPSLEISDDVTGSDSSMLPRRQPPPPSHGRATCLMMCGRRRTKFNDSGSKSDEKCCFSVELGRHVTGFGRHRMWSSSCLVASD